MRLAVTGHRPQDLGGWSPEIQNRLDDIATSYIEALRPAVILSGMALGWDQAAVIAARRLRVPYIAFLPFPQQDSRWPYHARSKYRAMLEGAILVRVTGPDATMWAFHRRNEAMVDDCDKVLALWNGKKTGGTYNCIRYALKKQKPVKNVWSAWEPQLV